MPSPSDIKIKYWDERLQCLLRLCKLTFPFIAPQKNTDIAKISKDFEEIFFCFVSKKSHNKRKISFNNPFYDILDTNHKINKAMEDCWKVYDVDVVHQKISQFLASYIYKLSSKAEQDGRNNPDIASIIYASSDNCQIQNCRMHHAIPTSLPQLLKLVRLQYKVVRRLDVLYHYGLLREEKSKEFLGSQKWWAEKLVKCHIIFQSPQKNCPEVTSLINDANNIWLFNESKSVGDFEVLLKSMFFIQRMMNKKAIGELHREMSKTKMISRPNDLPVGFEYYCGNFQVIPVGRHLSLFFSFLHNNKVISAIISSTAFIRYAIKNIKKVNLSSSDALDELTSLMEFTTSLIFAVGQEYCDICLPRAYLINYFEAFTAKPLIPGRYIYSEKNYLYTINNSLVQVQRLLNLLFGKEQVKVTIILRLIRLMILIGLNEPTVAQKILGLFNSYSKYNFSIKFKKYLEENNFKCLVTILHNDLREIRCDSLVIVRHQNVSTSKFACFEKYGIKYLTYSTIEEFRSFLRKFG
ncbi:6166_t:CDS:1 [Funneliformis caledonium]|uniref:6166_t:CDS:1 n=1 Tax=Funneliformis caledonium TaxID=1117310 RepID=A0A9N9DK31_9GLOM|nr:6166_t:CDS:1 [Funneliformis caledonium]